MPNQYTNVSLWDRVWSKVDVAGWYSCWEWTGAVTSRGYGEIHDDGHMRQAHRVVYELLVGPILDGLDLDHLCRNRRCVNPDHLQPVTHRENMRRGTGFIAHRMKQTHCLRGHEFTPENTWTSRRGQRACRACARLRARRG